MFDKFNDNARIWIYGFRKELQPGDKDTVSTALKHFISTWQTHNIPVRGDFAIYSDRFAILIAENQVSGCSIDSSIAVFKELQKNHHLDALDFDLIFYQENDEIKSVRRNEFRNMVENNRISPDTPVFDLTVNTIGDFRSGKWKIPFEESWHWRAFKQSA